jgi:hypothetical protein
MSLELATYFWQHGVVGKLTVHDWLAGDTNSKVNHAVKKTS